MNRGNSKPTWTEDEKRTLVERAKTLRAKKGRALLARDIRRIRIRGRSPAAVKSQAARLGLYEPNRRNHRWTPREEAMLVVLAKQRGLGAQGIHERGFFKTKTESWESRTRDSLAQKMRRSGLVHPGRSEKARTAKRLTKSEKKELREALRSNVERKSTEAFARDFGVAPSTIRRYRQRWRIPHSWHRAMELPESVDKRRRRAAETIERNLELWKKRKEALLKRLTNRKERLAQNAKAAGRRLTLRTCEGCGRKWPETTAFFAPSPKRKDGKIVAKYLRRSCRVCPRRSRSSLR